MSVEVFRGKIVSTHVKKKTVPMRAEVIPKEPNSHVNFCSTFTAVRAKFSADARAVWN